MDGTSSNRQLRQLIKEAFAYRSFLISHQEDIDCAIIFLHMLIYAGNQCQHTHTTHLIPVNGIADLCGSLIIPAAGLLLYLLRLHIVNIFIHAVHLTGMP